MSDGDFSITYTDGENLNYYIEGSIFDSGYEGGSSCLFFAQHGEILVPSTNFSSNKANSIGTFSKFTNIKILNVLNYSTIADNIGSDECIHIRDISLIDSCNFINNSKTHDENGIIRHIGGSLTIKSCSFINNTVVEESYLICNVNDQLTVENCYIDSSIPNTFYNSVEPINSRALFVNKLVHFSIHGCRRKFVIMTSDIVNKLSNVIISLVNACSS